MLLGCDWPSLPRPPGSTIGARGCLFFFSSLSMPMSHAYMSCRWSSFFARLFFLGCFLFLSLFFFPRVCVCGVYSV